MAHVYTLANAKGGCGKSTVALNLAVCFTRAGYRTLAIDLDQQANLNGGQIGQGGPFGYRGQFVVGR